VRGGPPLAAALAAGLVFSAAAAGAPRHPVLATSGISPTELAGVSCTRPSWCMAVGHYTGRSGRRHALAQIWNGTSWRVLSPPGRALTGVSCSARSFCMASGGPTGAERWDGRAWRTMASPKDGVGGVSCGTRKLCMVAHHEGVVRVWNGTAWHAPKAPAAFCTGNAPGPCGFNDVSCSGGATCLAVGTWQVSNTEQDTLGFFFNGKGWHATFPPNKGNPSEMFNVSCAGSLCMAAGGGFSEVNGGDLALAGARNAKTGAWTDVSPSLGTICTGFGTCAWTTSLSCGTARNCMAFGPQGNQWWNGSSWQPKPSISAGRGSSLRAVSCGGGSCLAVGYRTIRGARHTLAERWNGTTWRILHTPAIG
jgi:hypothetical protein